MITHDLRLIADAILDKKGENVLSLDLRSIDGAITDWFVVCDASNTTQQEGRNNEGETGAERNMSCEDEKCHLPRQ